MSLRAPTRFGQYEISAPIGAGGLGEVYLAMDARLGREVALKVLPKAFATNPDRVARFEREATLLASLNHRNIAHIYGFESATQPDGSTAHFLAMELVVYEMLTGSRLFAAGTWSDTLAAVLTTAPDWSLLPAGTPPSVRRLLHRFLERDARRRPGWIGGARLELDDSMDDDAPGARATTEVPARCRGMPVLRPQMRSDIAA
ncbi:MAG: protein kinase [Thermoanaerobaculia bacterium]